MSLSARVGVTRDRFRVDIDLDVTPGETVALLGANGSGKTTFLRAVAGLQALDSGAITVDGIVVDDAAGVFVPTEERNVGLVFQHYALFDHLTVRDNIGFGPAARKLANQHSAPQVDQLMAQFDLDGLGDRYPHQLSGGQAQRVAVARALAASPRVLLLDEPLAALDAPSRRAARRDLAHHLAGFDGMRILVTHDPVDVYALADRVAIIEQGSLVQVGTVAEVTAHPRSLVVAEMVGTNLVRGVVSADGLTTASGQRLPIVADFVGPGWASIRPQSIVLAPAYSARSARISLAATITEIAPLVDRVRVTLDGPVPLTAEVTPAAVAALGLMVGSSCVAEVKATDVAVYPA